MNKLGKPLVVALTIVTALLIILEIKRGYRNGEAPLLSQPAEDSVGTASTSSKHSPRPRVLQAIPATQHDGEILSPTGSHYRDAEFEPTRSGGSPITPIPFANPGSKPRSLEAPDLVPVAKQVMSPATGAVGDAVSEAAPVIDTPQAPVTRPLTEFVLTDAEDSFWSISERVYGSGVYYRALFRHNEAKVLRPDQLRAGVEVRTPPLEVLRERYPTDFPDDPAVAP